MFPVAAYETYSDGAVIFKDGSHGDWIYMVEEGQVEISKQAGDNKKVVIEILKPGDWFGELAYIGRMERTATATAVGLTVVGLLDRDYFDHEFNKLPANFQAMFKLVAVRLRNTTDRIVELRAGQK
jgi:CRP-like cAMP-binding protein